MDESTTGYARGLATKVVDQLLSKSTLSGAERERRRDLVLKYPRVVEIARERNRQMMQGTARQQGQSACGPA